MPLKYAARVRTFSMGPKYHLQPMYLAGKHTTKAQAIEQKDDLKTKGFAVRIVRHKGEDKYITYARKW